VLSALHRGDWLSHPRAIFIAVDVACPECDRLIPQVDGWEMSSQPRCYRCTECEMKWEQDPSGLLVEVDDLY
jgi:hypothetical protein